MPPDGTGFAPPVLPYPTTVASLCGRLTVEFAAAGMPCRLRLVAPDAQSGDDAGRRLRFRVDGIEGALLLPALPADMVLRAVEPAPLGPHDPATAALLLEFALADALSAIEAASGTSVELLTLAPDTTARSGDILVGGEGQVGDVAFEATLALPPPLFERVRSVVLSTLPPDPPVPVPPALLGVRIGIARLAATVVASLAPGDAVIPDILLAPAEALLVIGERLATRARLDGTRLVLDNVPSPIAAEWEDWIVSSDDAGGGGGAAIAPEDAGFGELQVTLVFELGRRTLPMAEVVGLAFGHVIELGPVEGATVSVLANGVRLGRGELVRVGDALAIRLTQIGSGR